MTSYYHHPEPFVLESGVALDGFTIAYHTFGEINADRSNVVWVCHALTANSDVKDWWPGTVEPDGFLNPGEYFIVCANIIGSNYGTTGPLSTDPATGEPYYGTFPAVTMRDIARAHSVLATALGIDSIYALIGSSVGGFQALEWAAQEPSRFGRIVLIATDAKASPWNIAVNETQRLAIRSDSTFGKPSPDAGRDGLAAARAIGLLTYRGPEGYNATQHELDGGHPEPGNHRACTYQRYQGEKLCRRFNAYSYMSILNSFDTHDIGRDRGGLAAALATLTAPALVVGISTDIIFTPAEMRALAQALPQGRYAEIESAFGHDGFLVEHRCLNSLLIPFMHQ